MSAEESYVVEFQPRFTCHRELLTHLFNNKGVEISLVKSAVYNDNVSLLTEIVCFILDRPGYPNHVQDLEPGTRCAELATISFLGINQGAKPLDNQYNILFYLFSQAKPAELLDFFRIMRSRTDFTSESFREALATSPLHEYKKFVCEKLVTVTPGRRHFYTLAYVTAMLFNGSNNDNLNRWLHTEEPESDLSVISSSITLEQHYQTVEHIYNEIFRNGIGGINTPMYKALLDADKPILKSSPSYDVEGFPNDEACQTMPYLARAAVLRFETFALSYLSIFTNDYEISLLEKEKKKSETTPERKAQIDAEINSYNLLREDYKTLFAYLVKQFGIDLCSISEIISVYLCAKVYGDSETQALMTKMAGINDDNMWDYDHTVRIKFMKDVNMLDGMEKATAKPPTPQTTVLEFFIRRNLIKGAEYIMKLFPDKTLQELAGESNYIALTASTAVAHPSTVKWLIRNKAKLCTNSKTGSKNNVFVCALFSMGSPESRLEMIVDAYQFAKRNPAYKPEVTPEEFFEAARMAWSLAQWKEGVGMRVEQLEFTLENLVSKEKWAKFQETPQKYLQQVANAISMDLFNISDFTLFTPEALQYFHNQMLRFIKLVLPQAIAGRLVGESLFRRIIQIAFSFKNVPLLAYLISFGPKIELNEFIGLAQTSSSSFDYRDLITINSPSFDWDNSNSELAMGFKSFEVHSYSLAAARDICGEMVDVDYVELDTLKELEAASEDPNLTKEQQQLNKRKMWGAAARHGVRDLDWNAFDPENNKIIVGGDGYDQDGQEEEYIDDADTEDHLVSTEYENGISHLQGLFAANNNKPYSQRSPFLSMLELMYSALSNPEEGTGADIEFGRLWLDNANSSVFYVTGHYLFFAIMRELFPHRTLNIPLFSQLYVAHALVSSWNRRVWQDDFMVDAMIQIIGATDHKQVTKLFEDWNALQSSDQQIHDYLTARGEVLKSMDAAEEILHEDLTASQTMVASVEGGVSEAVADPQDDYALQPIASTKYDLPIPYSAESKLHTAPTNTVFNIGQFILTHKPFTFNKTAENLVISLVMAITFGYCSVVSSQMYRKQQEWEQKFAMAQRQGKQPPPPPASFCPPQFVIDSARLFTVLFNQIKWMPQLFLKLAVVQFEINTMHIVADLFDTFISNGGELIHEDLKICRMFPAHYPVLLRPDRMDRLYGYFQYIVETIHGHNLEELEKNAEEATKHFQQLLDENDASDELLQEERKLTPQEIAKQKEQQLQQQQQSSQGASAASYVLPVVATVGAALLGIAGYFLYSSQANSNSDDAPVEKKKKK